MTEYEPEDCAGIEEPLGIQFRNRDLLQQALVHRSYLNERPASPMGSNERLEFLGDAVIGMVVAEMLFQRLPDAAEGDLTRLRAALVRGNALAHLASTLNLGVYLKLSRGEESTGGRKRPSILAGAFEALVGALLVDRGIESARQFVTRMLEPRLRDILAEKAIKDAKSHLQELAQAQLKSTPTYRIVAEEGPDHAKVFTALVEASGRKLGEGAGKSKQEAEQRAATDALSRWAGE